MARVLRLIGGPKILISYENKEKYQFEDNYLIQYLNLQTSIIRIVWLTVRRMKHLIWELKVCHNIVSLFLQPSLRTEKYEHHSLAAILNLELYEEIQSGNPEIQVMRIKKNINYRITN
ncbi:hypothetical protein pdam_00011948 [Pocillopora damicornis]|uniref:Uncharacterized protein n=1 Tax=Pocillopora damicornis TaxID=46731 RepID=A0A3M6U0F8_POCDA|nr:hypothetical protein pdam_00011948 [Pocillopora damicornis]